MCGSLNSRTSLCPVDINIFSRIEARLQSTPEMNRDKILTDTVLQYREVVVRLHCLELFLEQIIVNSVLLFRNYSITLVLKRNLGTGFWLQMGGSIPVTVICTF